MTMLSSTERVRNSPRLSCPNNSSQKPQMVSINPNGQRLNKYTVSRLRHESISSASAKCGRMSSGSCGKSSGGQPTGNREDAGTCKYPSCFPWRCAMRRLWTSSRPQKSRSSHVAEQSRVYLAGFLFLFSFFSFV